MENEIEVQAGVLWRPRYQLDYGPDRILAPRPLSVQVTYTFHSDLLRVVTYGC